MTSHAKRGSYTPSKDKALTPTEARLYQGDNITPPIVFHAASTTGLYRTPAWNVREGGDDHAKYRSRGS